MGRRIRLKPFTRLSMRLMKRYLQILKSCFQCSLMLEMEYVFNFFFGGLFELAWLIMYILLLNVIFLGTGAIGDWGKYEVLLLTFQGGLTDALMTCFAVPGLSRLPQLVNTGELDFYLLKPIHLRFNLSVKNFSFSQSANVVINIGGILYCLHQLKARPSVGLVLGYLLVSLSGFIIIDSILFALMSLSFWLFRMDGVMGVCPELITVGNKPYTIYPRILQKILIYMVPILAAFNGPVIFLIRNHSPVVMLVPAGCAAVWIAVSNFIFKRGLKKYVSAGS